MDEIGSKLDNQRFSESKSNSGNKYYNIIIIYDNLCYIHLK